MIDAHADTSHLSMTNGGKEPTVRTVTGCADCPFLWQSHCCQEGRWLEEDERDCWVAEGKSPDWCPLREGDITVRLER